MRGTATWGLADRLAQLWQAAARVDRADYFGGQAEDEARFMPVVNRDDARTASPGYLGTRYRPGHGPLLLGINPGGGGTNAARVESVRANRPVYRALRGFRDASPEGLPVAFEGLNGAMARVMLTWPIGKLYQAVIDAKAEWTLEHLAVMNIVPYRTRPGKHPPKKAVEVGWRTLVEPSLQELDPAVVFALGAKPRNAILDWGGPKWNRRLRYLERQRNDTRVTPAALEVLDDYVRENPTRPRRTAPRLVRPAPRTHVR